MIKRAECEKRLSARTDGQRIHRYRGLLVGVIVATCLAPSPSFSAECTGTAVAPSFQSPGRSAGGVLTFGNRVILIDDAGERARLLICSPQGTTFVVDDKMELGKVGAISKIDARNGVVFLTTDDGKTIEKRVSSAENKVKGADVLPPDGFAYSSNERPDGGQTIKIPLIDSPRKKGAGASFAEVEVKPIVPGAQVSTVKVLHTDDRANAVTVFWDEVGNGTRAFIARFTGGKLASGSEISLEDLENIPENFIGVLGDGRAYYLRTKGDKSWPVLIEMDTAFAQKVGPKGEIYERLLQQKQAGKQDQGGTDQKKRNRQTKTTDGLSDAEIKKFEEAVRKSVERETGEHRKASAPVVTRDEVAKCAVDFRDLVWTMTPGSYERAGVPDKCDPQAHYWRRPYYLKGKSGQKVTSVPYCWGCSHSIERFLKNVETGSKLAGHSCTCRSGHYCIRQDVTGVDCSGFVSQCWKTSYHTTATMDEIADEIDISEIKKGDAFNKSSGHILLFLELVKTPTGKRYRLIEATNDQGRIGRVRQKDYTASALNNYEKIRYRKIID